MNKPTYDYLATQQKLAQLCNMSIDLVNMPNNGRRAYVERLCKKLGIVPVEKGEID